MPPPPSGAPVRADLQGLRALAVTLVVVFHVWPAAVPGGYVGVDVFFVLSGFLITSHLLREAESTGTVRIARFWARRALRLLPAAMTVLAVTLIGVWVVAPVGFVERFLGEIAWSALYVENWALAGSSVDYLQAEAAASPVQHYWSLSVEEQFYLLWPVLVLGGLWIAARAGRRSVRPVLAIVLGAIVLVSLLWSILFTWLDPAPAYFATTTRAWEFGAGGLLALAVAPGAVDRRVDGRAAVGGAVGRWMQASAPVRSALAWSGLAVIVVSAFRYSAATPFPGAAAVAPVVGTLLVVWAANPGGRASPNRVLALRPVQWLGDQSYGVYLWHWPVIVLTGFALGRAPSFAIQVAMIVSAVGLAAVTTRYVERPIRFGAPSKRGARRVLAVAAVSMLALVAVTTAGVPAAEATVDASQAALERLVDDPPACFGAEALIDTSPCPLKAGSIIPDESIADEPPERCISGVRAADFEACSYGASPEHAARTIALVGDSHAEQWLPALAELAADRSWRVHVITKSSCPFSDAVRTEPGVSDGVLDVMNDGCRAWNEDALAYLAAHPSIDTVLLAARGRNPVVADAGEPWQETAMDDYEARWRELPANIEHIIVLRDTPRMRAAVLDCVRAAGDARAAAEECDRPRLDALEQDPQYSAALAAVDPRVRTLDLSDAFCGPVSCAPVIGTVLVYRDSHHVTWVYAATLAPLLGERLEATRSVPEG